MPVTQLLSLPLLEICHADYTVGHKKILDDLSFSIKEGEIHAMIGTNGLLILSHLYSNMLSCSF